jgi:hypothetical protein
MGPYLIHEAMLPPRRPSQCAEYSASVCVMRTAGCEGGAQSVTQPAEANSIRNEFEKWLEMIE